MAAAQEERFTRIKNDASFPTNAIKYCLDYCGVQLGSVDYVVFYEKPFLKFERLLETFVAFAPKGIVSYLKAMPIWVKDKLFMKRTLLRGLWDIDPLGKFDKAKVLFNEHHLSHAASAFLPSPFQEAVILTMDGVGEWGSTSVALGKGNQIRNVCEIRFPHSIGLLYSAFTYYLGFKVNCDEYKVMGLAPYGEPVYAETILQNLVDVKEDGSFRLNLKFFNFTTGLTMTSNKFEKLFGQPRRQPSDPLTSFHTNVAGSIQQVTEQIVLKIARSIREKYHVQNLCLAGGVALNCVANGRLLKEAGFKNIWIQPAAGDAGGAWGAAMYAYHCYLKKERFLTDDANDGMKNALLGPEFSTQEILSVLQQLNIRYSLKSDDEFFTELAALIAEGNVVGWFSGRMEFGPRALGSRSIIADARRPDMQSVLNQKIKFRESFRPFAPAVLEKYCSAYFDLDKPSPYMLFTAEVAKSKQLSSEERRVSSSGFDRLQQSRSVIPAVTHVDNSARVQTVNKTNGDFYKLLKAFYQLTDCPVLINTSFNIMDEPIVCSPADAVRCFQGTDMDVLAFKNIIIYKHENQQTQANKLQKKYRQSTVMS